MHQSGVLNPIALTMHHPALASKIAKQPPNAIAAAEYHQRAESMIPVRITPDSRIENPRANMPIFNLTALPFAPMLHCIFSPD